MKTQPTKSVLALLVLLLLTLFLVAQTVWADSRGVAANSGITKSNRRVALVIGNAAYEKGRLKNPVNDARLIARTLERVGFEVITGENLSQKQMRRAIDRFGRKIRSGGVGLFYFAGHGMQVYGRNFLIPIGAKVEIEQDVEYEAVDVGRVLAKMDGADNRLNIVILDACRNNPLVRSVCGLHWQNGLSHTKAPSGTIIAYATAPGSVAADGYGANGLYTRHLAANINKPGLKLEDVFKRTRVAVQKASFAKQVPWESSSLTGDFYFRPGRTSQEEPEETPPPREPRGPFFVGEFSDEKLLEMVFKGDIIEKLSKIKCDKVINRKKMAAKVRVGFKGFKSGYATVAAKNKYYIYDQEKIFVVFEIVLIDRYGLHDCHACSPLLAAAIFEKYKDRYYMTSSNKCVENIGSWGRLPKLSLCKIGKDKFGYLLDYWDGNQGCFGGSYFVLYYQNGRYGISNYKKGTDNIPGGIDLSGALKDTVVKATVEFEKTLNNEFYDIILRRTGIKEGRKFNEVKRYAFDGKNYRVK